MLYSLIRWFRRNRIVEIDRIKSGTLPTIASPSDYVCDEGEVVHAIARASAESEAGKSFGTGLLVLTTKGMAFIGGTQSIRYAWRQIDTSGVRFNGTGSYSVNTKRGRTIDFHLTKRWDAEQIHAVDYALNAPGDDC